MASLSDYVASACRYQEQITSGAITGGQKKAPQIALSRLLAEVIASDLAQWGIRLETGERRFIGGLAGAQIDAHEASEKDGLRVGIEIKTVNEAAGRAMWNRVNDLRSFAVNFHWKFPFAVLGGLIAMPNQIPGEPNLTVLIQRVSEVLERVNGRPNEAAPGHLLEAACLLVYDRGTRELDPSLPAVASQLRYDNFLEMIGQGYRARFFME